jgi:hypothetical protein
VFIGDGTTAGFGWLVGEMWVLGLKVWGNTCDGTKKNIEIRCDNVSKLDFGTRNEWTRKFTNLVNQDNDKWNEAGIEEKHDNKRSLTARLLSTMQSQFLMYTLRRITLYSEDFFGLKIPIPYG